MEGASSNSDIWSLGATIIEMVTGNPPHYHLNPNQALYRVISGDPPPIPDTVSPVYFFYLFYLLFDILLFINDEFFLAIKRLFGTMFQKKSIRSTCCS